MRILIIRNYPSFMEVQHNTYNIQEVGLARAFVRKGHFCDLIFWTDNREFDLSIEVEPDRTITVFYLNSKVFLKNAVYPGLDRFIANYDIIQLAEYNQFQTWQLAQKYPDKTIVYHGPYLSPYNKRYNLMCRFFDVFCLNKYIRLGTRFITKSNLAKEFLQRKGIEEHNITVAGVGIDPDSFSTKRNENEKMPDFIKGIDNFANKLKLLYIGRLEARRNIPFLFEVVRAVKEKGVPVELIMIGNGEAEYVESCNRYADKLGINKCIYHTEKLEQKYLPGIYQKCDLFLLPTHYEIFGMVLLEAMYYGLPVITTKNGGSDMLIENKVNGFVLDFDIENWVHTIMTAAGNPELYKKIGCKARATINENYTWDSVADTILQGYQTLRDGT